MHILCNTGTSLYFWVKCLVKIAVDGETARDGYLTECQRRDHLFLIFFKVVLRLNQSTINTKLKFYKRCILRVSFYVNWSAGKWKRREQASACEIPP